MVCSPNDDHNWSWLFLLALAIKGSLSSFSSALHGFDYDGSSPLLLCDGIDTSQHLHGGITPLSAAATATATGAKKTTSWLSFFLLALAITTSSSSSLSS
jgi:hypothetical protein